ncbi:bacillithiol biosynthesis cysteine-adding enzyme BshC [Gemmatimonadota bacterium]
MNPRFEASSFGTLPAHEIVERSRHRLFPVDPAMRSAFLAFGTAEENVERLFVDGALCVTTGQQPGLLTGPLYTVYKALSAVSLAKQLEKEVGRPVVPVFWVAADDHDFAEANHCFLPSGSSEVVRVALRERESAAELTPMYKEPVGDDIAAVLEQLHTLTRETEFRPKVFEWIQAHYRPESDLASAFGGALAELLGRFGLVVFYPTHVRAKQVMAPKLVAALEQAAGIDRCLTAHAQELVAQGKPAPISVGDSATAVLIESSLGRDRLVIEGDGFRTRRAKEQWSLAALKDVAENEPQRLSPNVLLRPVVEAAILPTVAYVAGPGELKYLPQAAPIYRALDVEPQIAVGRWAGRFIEGRTAKTLDKYDIEVDDLNLPDGRLEARVLHDQMPAEAADAIRRLSETIKKDYGTLSEAAERVDSTLRKPIGAAERGALRDLAGVEKKIVNQLKQLNEVTVRQLAAARTSIFPLGKLQERVFNVVPYLVRYGDDFLDGVYAQCQDWAGALETTAHEA